MLNKNLKLLSLAGSALTLLAFLSASQTSPAHAQNGRLRQLLQARRAARGQGQNTTSQSPGLSMSPQLLQRIEGKAAKLDNFVFNVPYGEDPLQKLDIYILPPEAKEKYGDKNRPVVFYVHGGGWHTGDKAMNLEKGQTYARDGVIYVSVNYRLAPKDKHPKQIEDVARAFAWTRHNITKYGGNPDHIYVMGHSAGAHLVDLLATNDKYLQDVGENLSAIKGVVSLDTASVNLLTVAEGEGGESRLVGPMISQAFGSDKAILKEASPTLCLTAGKKYPPFLLYCGQSRKTARQTHEEFVQRLKSLGGKVELKVVPFNHKEINVNAGTAGQEMYAECLSFVSGSGESGPQH